MSQTQLSRAPVGVLDSGLGGLSVLKALRAELPAEDFVYCADCGNAPWGDKTQDFVLDRCRAICRFLIGMHAKMIVLACNTATALAADALRSEFALPIVGIEPAVKPASVQSRSHVIGVLATNGTIQSSRYRFLTERFGHDVRIISTGAPGLMECVEKGDFTGPRTRALAQKYLAPMQKAGIDKLVLGCTHYPFLSDVLHDILGPEVELIEPGPAVACVAHTRLRQISAARTLNASPAEQFFIKKAVLHKDVLLRLWPQAENIAELAV